MGVGVSNAKVLWVCPTFAEPMVESGEATTAKIILINYLEVWTYMFCLDWVDIDGLCWNCKQSKELQ